MPSQHAILYGTYDFRLVSISILIALLASYTSLELAERIAVAGGRKRIAWLLGGASTMGAGIWSMHYVGMLAFRLPVPTWYDWPTVLVSLIAAILASAVALLIASGDGMSMQRALAGSVLMGTGIAAMHYIGMEAMRTTAMCHFNGFVVGISVVLAIAISFVALWLFFFTRKKRGENHLRKVLSATVMGAAIPIMHYTGMAAATFTHAAEAPNLSHAVNITRLGTTGIVLVTVMILCLATLRSADDRLTGQANRPMRLRMRSAGIRALQTAILSGFFMLAVELLKTVPQHHLSVWTSSSITIAVASLLAGGLSLLALKSEEGVRFNLAASESRYRSLFERSLAGVFRTRLDGHILDCNDAFARILGYSSPQELLDSTITDFYANPAERQTVVARLRAEKTLSNLEYCLQKKDGSPVWVLVNATLWESESPSDNVIEGNFTDITERRQSEEGLHRLAAIVRCSDDAILSQNADGIIQTWNAGAERIYGYSAEEAIGRGMTFLASTERAHEIEDILANVRAGKEVKHFETVRKKKSGEQIK